MISVNSTYTNLINNGAQFEWQIKNGANTFTKANLVSGSIASTLCEGVSIGNTISAQLDLQLLGVTVDTSNPLVVQFKATNGSSSSSWYTKGTFYIDTIETSPYSDITKIQAFDSMLMTEYVYQLYGDWTSVTDLVVLNKITGFIGISLESATQTLFTNSPKTLSNAPNIGEDGTTAREMLSYIGALRGGNWRITPDNKLQLIILSTSPSNTASVGDAVTDIDASPAETVKKVRVWINDTEFYAFPELPLTDHSLNPITTHTLEEICIRASQWATEWEAITGRTIDVQIPFFCDYTQAKAIYTQFVNKVYYPYTSRKAFVDPKYEVGDGITIKTTTSIIASQAIDISPLAPSSVELKKDEMINSLYPYKAPFRRKTNYQMSKNTAKIAENTAQIAQNTSDIAQVPTLIQQQTDLISGGYGGYIKFNKLPDGTPSEMLVMDTPDEATATDIIRLNMNGLGFSTDGGATYANAWTIDGKLNADFIQTGHLNVNRITGSIADSGNTWSIDFTNGSLTIGNITANKITSGTLNVGNLTVTGTIQDNLSTPKNSWNLTTGEFKTTQGKIGDWEIYSSGLRSQGVVGDTDIVPGSITAETKTLTYNRQASLTLGQVAVGVQDAYSNWLNAISMYATTSDASTFYGVIQGYQGQGEIKFTYNSSAQTNSINISTDSFTVNNRAVLLNHFEDVTIGNVTIGANGYLSISSYKPAGTVLAAWVYDCGTVSTKDSINVLGNGNYLHGTANASVTNLKIRYLMQ